MAFDLIQMPSKELIDVEDKFSWRLLVFSMRFDSRKSATLGRHSTCDFKIDSPRLPYFLSRKHARLEIKAKQLIIEDLGSTNGTYKNNIKLSPNSAVVLNNGDIVAFGCKCELKPLPGHRVDPINTPLRFRIQSTHITKFSPVKVEDDCPESSENDCNTTIDARASPCKLPKPRYSSFDGSDSGFGEIDLPCTSSRYCQIVCTNNPTQVTACIKLSQSTSLSPGLSYHRDKKQLSAIQLCSSGKVKDRSKSSIAKRKCYAIKSPHKNSIVVKKSTSKPTRNHEQPEHNSLQHCMEQCASADCKLSTNDERDTINWVQCDNCDQWYHTMCVGCDYDDIRDRTKQFYCASCVL